MLDEHPALRAPARRARERDGQAARCSSSPRRSASTPTVFEHNVLRVRDEQLAAARDRYLDAAARRAARRALPRERAADRAPARARCTAGAPVHLEHLRAPESHPAQGPAAAPRRRARRSGSRRRATSRRTSRSPRWARSRSSTSTQRSTRSATTASPATSSSAAPAAAAAAVYLRGFLEAHAMLRPPGLGGRPVPVRRRRPRRAGPLADGGHRGPAAPTSTRSATRSRASSCSTTGCGSCRARSTTRSRDAPIESIALLRIGAGTRRRRRATCSSALYDRVAVGGFVDRRGRASSRTAGGGRGLPARGAASPSRSSGSAGRASALAQGRPRHRSRPRRASPPARGAPGAARAAARRRAPSTCRSSSSSTTCAARRRARCTRCRARTSRASTTSTTR